VPEFPPIAHVAVTVTDLGRSTRWYSQLLAAEPVLDEEEQAGGFHHTVFAIGGGHLLGLHTHPGGAAGSFDEHHAGLDHLAAAFGLPYQRLDQPEDLGKQLAGTGLRIVEAQTGRAAGAALRGRLREAAVAAVRELHPEL